MDRHTQTIETYINEYNLVSNKITSLSLKFSSGSYIIPISLFVSIFSMNMDSETPLLNIVFIVMPIILSFYLYNHIRYMALQFKLSGYAKHLENKINEILEDKVLLWENTIARNNRQNYYEGIFFGIIYVCILVLMYYTAYSSLAKDLYRDQSFYGFPLLISVIYYYLFFLIIFFLLFFTNEHNITFRKASFFSAIKLTDELKESRVVRKTIRLTIIKILFIVIVFLLTPSSLLPLTYFSKYSVISTEENYDYIIILGNKSIENEPSEDMKERLYCLMENIDDYQNSTIVLTGGNGEANLMNNFLVENNIINYPIILEEASQNTHENLVNTRNLVSGNVLVITSDYHVLRTSLICNKLDLDWNVLPAKSNNPIFLKSLRECYAIYFEYLFLALN